MIEKETGGGQRPPLKREHRKYAQGVLLVTVDEDVSCRDPKGRPVHIHEY